MKTSTMKTMATPPPPICGGAWTRAWAWACAPGKGAPAACIFAKSGPGDCWANPYAGGKYGILSVREISLGQCRFSFCFALCSLLSQVEGARQLGDVSKIRSSFKFGAFVRTLVPEQGVLKPVLGPFLHNFLKKSRVWVKSQLLCPNGLHLSPCDDDLPRRSLLLCQPPGYPGI